MSEPDVSWTCVDAWGVVHAVRIARDIPYGPWCTPDEFSPSIERVDRPLTCITCLAAALAAEAAVGYVERLHWRILRASGVPKKFLEGSGP